MDGISHMTVARIWAKNAIKPHRVEGYLASNDPDFEAKAADVIGLYLNPPQHAAVFCVDEKKPSRRWIATTLCCPCRLGAPSGMASSTSVTARCRCMRRSTPRPAMLGKTATRHTSAEFVAFLADIVVHQPKGKEVHVIADNLGDPQDQAGASVPGRSSQCPSALHADLLVLA
jgi:hypothetical protein